MSRKISDKERLDWLQSKKSVCILLTAGGRRFTAWPHDEAHGESNGQTVRKCLDAAILSARRSKKRAR